MDRHPDTAGGQAPLRALVVDDEPPLVGLVTRYLETRRLPGAGRR